MSAERTPITPQTAREDAARIIAAALCSAGNPTAKLDARFLVQGILGIDAMELKRDGATPVGEHAERLENAKRRRLANEPVARILGSRGFYGRDFIITPDVLDPRADTETLIELALRVIDERGWRDEAITLVDIGTGSGAIAVTLLAELPKATAVATDISEAALAIAAANAAALGVADRIVFRHGSGLAGLTAGIDLIVSNPPYIPSAVITGLDSDVRDYDPVIALDGGPDGLDCYREIASQIKQIEHCGLLLLEFGAGQGDAVAAIFEAEFSFAAPPVFATDLGGHRRAVAFQLQNLFSQSAISVG